MLLILFLLFSSCHENTEKQIIDFDITYSGEVFVYVTNEEKKGNNIHIKRYKSNKEIIINEKGNHVSSLSLTEKGDSLLYLRYSPFSSLSEIILYDIKNNNKKILHANSEIKTELRWLNSETIVFISASEYKKYSPISAKSLHGMDLYSMSINNSIITKITNLNSYSINNLKVKDKERVFFIENLNHLYSLDLRNYGLTKYEFKNKMKNKYFTISRFDFIDDSEMITLYSNYLFYSSLLNNIPKKINFRTNSHVKKMKYIYDGSFLFLTKTPSNIIFQYFNKAEKIKYIELL